MGFMAAGPRLDAISIVLVRTRFPENIGSVARVMKNMGLSRLILVDGCSPFHTNAYKLASGAEDILERAEEAPTLMEAVSEMEFLAGMTSRSGRERTPLLTPGDLMDELIPLTATNSAGLVFGSEKEGLTREELSLCHRYVRIPSSQTFPSLNLAQAVTVLCYELLRASWTAPESPARLAQSDQIEKMFKHMERTLVEIGFSESRNPKRIMGALRRLFGRSRLAEREIRILHGIWSKMDWQMKKRGGNEGKPGFE
jgi:tRNA/rRNA methyltransferase